MIGSLREWVIRQLTLGHFSTRSDVVWRAATLAAKVGILALCIHLAMEATMAQFGLLPYPFSDSVKMIFIMSPTISFMIGFVAYLLVGFAIYDLSRERSEFELLSRTDQLSGLANRRAFLETFDECDRQGKALLVFDVDHFKTINDRYGHAAGDLVIVAVAGILAKVFSGRARVARVGGEEFAVLLCDCGLAEAMALGEVVRMRVEALRVAYEGEEITVTISGGVSTLTMEDSFTSAFSRADRALYRAKHQGRNQILPAPAVAEEPSLVDEGALQRRRFRDASSGRDRAAS